MSGRAQLYQYKGNCCSSCGVSINEMVARYGTFERIFELHHIDPEKKADNYNNLIKRNLSSEQLDEVDKCVLLCRICHGLIHAQNNRAQVTITIDFDGRSISQVFNGWLITDAIDNSTKFFSEEKILLTKYLEQVNGNKPNIIFGVDLEDGKRYQEKVDQLEEGDCYQIFHAESNDLMLKATKTSKGIELEVDIQFGFIEIDASKAPKGTRFWYRNGYLLRENGEVETEGTFKFGPNKQFKSDS
ncbi:HNH endonuclease signature motif containing protein [Vibrio cholerae]|uniref:HNH endonuclease signature motif containing protein n=1 Tax=Vibrio cholerae TaxID=666 RepID=UPI0011D7A1A5|nr:HNH endonuclease signature motif containing protein [Vibrio cholerae]TXX50444.1 HNH endonuclease [Vibrio cholerae]